MTKPAGRRRVSDDGRHEKQYRRQPYDYDFKLKVINSYATAGIHATLAQYFPVNGSNSTASKRKLISKWNQRGIVTTLPQTSEAAIVKWVNDFRRDGAPVSSSMLKGHALDEAERLEIPPGVFSATWQWQNGFMRRHRFSFRVKTHTGQIAPPDALAQAAAFVQEVARRAEAEGIETIETIYNADQTAVYFELLPRTTSTAKGSKAVWVKCGKKEKKRMTAMVLGDSHGAKYPLFLVMKTAPSKIVSIEQENKHARHGFGRRLWAEVEPLQDQFGIQIYGNQSAWWTGALTVKFLRFHFGQRSVFSDSVMLLLDDFSGHWVKEAIECATSLNIVIVKVPPGLTWLCLPADAVWIKPIKDRLRHHWLLHLQAQIAAHRARTTAAPFEMKAPDRRKVARWASEAWNDIPASIIVSGFTHCKLGVESAALNEPEETTDMQKLLDAVVKDLEELAIIDTSDEVLGDEQDVIYQTAESLICASP